jgi:hypothetical protein
MKTEHRDTLAYATALLLPKALDLLNAALILISEGKSDALAAKVTEVQKVLAPLVPLCDSACHESDVTKVTPAV